MPGIFEYRHVVTPEEIDPQGHVGNLEYLRWMQDAAVSHSAVQGWPGERYLQTGAVWVVRSHFVEYLQSAYESDEIVVRTWVAGFKKITSLRKYQIIRPADNSVLLRGETNWAYVGLQQQVPKRIPPELAGAFENVTGENEPV